jgi:sirohydrochlorin ferrochelatase
MKALLVDNGSLEPAAHAGLRAAAAAIAAKADFPVDAVSWKHSSRIPAAALEGRPAQTLAPWVRAQLAAGEREFLLVPFFISPQGAIGSALRADLGRLQAETGGFDFAFTDGLEESGAIPTIIADQARDAAAARGLQRPAVIIVDHGGPSPASAEVRNRVANAVRTERQLDARTVMAASMESPDGPGFEFNRPLLSEALEAAGPGDVLIAPLFLLPGRHAGPGGDLERIARGAEARTPGLRWHFTKLVGAHPLATGTLAGALARALAVPSHS